MFRLDINIDKLAKYANKLEKVGRAALPMAVRQSLNDTATDVKKLTMPRKAKSEFEERNKTFFKANSKVQYASGYNINNMQATVGFFNNSRFNNHAVKELEQQEHGGGISNRSFIPTPEARVGKSKNKSIRANARLRAIKNTVVANSMPGKNDKQKFIHAVYKAGVGGTVLSEWKGKTFLWKINSLKRTKDGKLKMTALYSYKKNRSVNVKATHFMKEASLESAHKMELFYVRNANKTLERYTK